LGLKFSHWSKKNCVVRATLTPVFVRPLNLEPRKKIKSIEPSLEAMRIKKMRLRDNAFTIVGLHKNRTRFLTFTTIKNITSKKDFLYRMENCRRALKAGGYEIEYSGMIERQERGAWHLHAISYRTETGVYWHGLPAWDYEQMNVITERYGLHVHGEPIKRTTAATVAEYTSKLDAVITAAYTSKMENPSEDYCYTLTTKGCNIPQKINIYDEMKAREFIEFGNFKKREYQKNGFEFYHFLSEYEGFTKMDYQGWKG